MTRYYRVSYRNRAGSLRGVWTTDPDGRVRDQLTDQEARDRAEELRSHGATDVRVELVPGPDLEDDRPKSGSGTHHVDSYHREGPGGSTRVRGHEAKNPRR